MGEKPVKELKPRKVIQAPDINTIKEVVGVLLQNFIKEEAGNRVTNNNMAGLSINIMRALDGRITLNPPESQKE